MTNETKTSQPKAAKNAQGYAPQPPSPPMRTWRAPDLTEQEQAERDRMIAERIVPF